jgi:hypothetical protein
MACGAEDESWSLQWSLVDLATKVVSLACTRQCVLGVFFTTFFRVENLTMFRNMSVMALALLAVLATSGLAVADMAIPVTNNSFESPVTTAEGEVIGGTAYPWIGFNSMPGWSVVDTYRHTVTTDCNAGVVSGNEARFAGSPPTGGDGTQYAWFGTCVEGNQGNRALYQELSETYQAGQTYNLSAMLGQAPFGSPQNSTDTVRLELCYRTSTDYSAITNVASNDLAWSALNSGSLTSSSTSVTVGAGSAAIGQHIGIWIAGGTVTGGAGYYYLADKVELTATPEPCTAALLSIGLISLLAYAWRKRK